MSNKKQIFITSTMSGGVDYTIYAQSNGGLPVPFGHVSISGGTAVVSKNQIYTPTGVATSVTAEDYEMLKENTIFKKHISEGFLKVHNYKHETEEVAKDMVQADEGAQLTAEKLKVKNPRGAGRPPKTGEPTTR